MTHKGERYNEESSIAFEDTALALLAEILVDAYLEEKRYGKSK